MVVGARISAENAIALATTLGDKMQGPVWIPQDKRHVRTISGRGKGVNICLRVLPPIEACPMGQSLLCGVLVSELCSHRCLWVAVGTQSYRQRSTKDTGKRFISWICVEKLWSLCGVYLQAMARIRGPEISKRHPYATRMLDWGSARKYFCDQWRLLRIREGEFSWVCDYFLPLF